MSDSMCIAFEVILIESRGAFGTAGEPTLFCRYRAGHLPGTQHDDGQVSVVARDRSLQTWREHVRQTTVDDARAVVAHLAAMGIPGRTPDAEGTVDTSDAWACLFFRVVSGGKGISIEIESQSSGFTGADSDWLRALFRELFALAGFEDYCPVLYGSPFVPGDGTRVRR